MRLRRLDLTRYGCFTDFPVDFGERDPSKPDLHVIYGPNESGKSTLLAAFLLRGSWRRSGAVGGLSRLERRRIRPVKGLARSRRPRCSA